MSKLTVTMYLFMPYFDGYFQEGNFYSKDGKLLRQRYYNGRVCINCNGKRYGVKKLRSFAVRKEVERFEMPF